MTRKERAQVVELLRCAADNLSPTSRGAWTDALIDLGHEYSRIAKLASDAFLAVKGPERPFRRSEYEKGHTVYLEAAARVEEGTWP